MVQDVQQAKRALVTYLQQRQAAGEKRVYLSAEAKSVLRAFYAQARNPKPTVQAQTPVHSAQPVPVPATAPQSIAIPVVATQEPVVPAAATSGY